MENNEHLEHHGIKGMKWGIRRTEAQLARARGKVERLEAKLAGKDGGSSKGASVKAPAQRSISDMSDDELRSVINRKTLEQQYRNLNPEKVSAGKKFASHVANQIIIPASTTVARNAAQKIMSKIVDSAIDKVMDKKK